MFNFRFISRPLKLILDNNYMISVVEFLPRLQVLPGEINHSLRQTEASVTSIKKSLKLISLFIGRVLFTKTCSTVFKRVPR